MEDIKRRRLGAQAWQELLRRHAASGEPIATFCQREGVVGDNYLDRLTTTILAG